MRSGSSARSVEPWPKPTAMPAWLLIAVLRFLDGDIDASWNLIQAIGYENALEDDAVAYFLIE